MLSKSQARLFFLVATAGFSAVFLGLTVDTLGRVPARTHTEGLTPQVVHGKELWDRKNCMGCHTLLGEGAYYAPELTKVVDRRGAAWITLFLKDPAAMFPGERQMVNYGFSDAEIADLVAFLDWVGKMDTNGFPPPPDLALVSPGAAGTASPAGAPASTVDLAAAPETFRTVCVACHAMGGAGGVVGPALDHVGSKFDAASLDAWLANPASVKPGTAMPDLKLPASTRKELVDWLLTHR